MGKPRVWLSSLQPNPTSPSLTTPVVDADAYGSDTQLFLMFIQSSEVYLHAGMALQCGAVPGQISTEESESRMENCRKHPKAGVPQSASELQEIGTCLILGASGAVLWGDKDRGRQAERGMVTLPDRRAEGWQKGGT